MRKTNRRKKPLRRVSLSNRIEKREGRKEEKNRFKKKTKVSVKKTAQQINLTEQGGVPRGVPLLDCSRDE